MRDDDQHTEDQYSDHMSRLDAIRAAFSRGGMSYTEKRRQYAAENQAYYRGDQKSTVSGETITRMPRSRDEVAAILAEATGAPVEATRIALQRRREANHQAAHANTGAEASELIVAGRASFDQIMKSAIPQRGMQ